MVRSALLAAVSFVCGIAFMMCFVSGVEAQDRKTETTELLRADLGEWCQGKEALVAISASSVGNSARHFHPGHSFSYVLEGMQTITPDGKSPYTVKVGDLMREAPFEVSATRTIQPTKVLNVRILEKGKSATTVVQ